MTNHQHCLELHTHVHFAYVIEMQYNAYLLVFKVYIYIYIYMYVCIYVVELPSWIFSSNLVGSPVAQQWRIRLRCRRRRSLRFDLWVGKILWRRAWQPTAVCLLRKSHGQRSLVGFRLWGCRVWHSWSNRDGTPEASRVRFLMTRRIWSHLCYNLRHFACEATELPCGLANPSAVTQPTERSQGWNPGFLIVVLSQ